MASDDPLDQALELLQRPGIYHTMYGSQKTQHEMVVEPLVTALRNVIGEVQSLRDEVAELRGE